MVMRAGRLNQLVSIKKKSVTRNGVGEEVLTWEVIAGGADVWAAIEPVSGREYSEATQIHADVTTKIVLRYLSGVRSAMRVYHGDDIYELLSPPIDKRHRHESLELMCKWIEPEVVS